MTITSTCSTQQLERRYKHGESFFDSSVLIAQDLAYQMKAMHVSLAKKRWETYASLVLRYTLHGSYILLVVVASRTRI